MLNVEELLELEENIKEELDDHLTAALSKMNRSGQLEDFLRQLGMEHLLQKESGYEVYKTGKIVVIGQSDVKPEVLLSILLIVGPMPHSGSGKGGYGSVISALESEDGYPPVVRLGSNGLKITKSDFRAKLEEMIQLRKIS